MDLKELTNHAVQAALDAGELIRYYLDCEVEVLHKEGGHSYASQVVTEVDRKAHIDRFPVGTANRGKDTALERAFGSGWAGFLP